MLQFLRKRGNIKKIMWVLAILIIPAFVLWGSGSAIRSKDLPKYAGRIFGKKISFREYETNLLACKNLALLIYGENFNKIVKYLNLEDEAWDRLILLQEAKKQRIKVPDKEVINFIENLPLFQKQGRFNQERYRVLLDYAFRAGPRDFEEQIRQMLKIEKLKANVISPVNLSDEEIEKAYKNENEKAKVSYVLIEPQNFIEEIHPSYKELQGYYQNHKLEFKKPAQVNVRHIALYFDQTALELNLGEEEIRNYYQEHPEQFFLKGKKGKENRKPFEEVKGQIEENLIRQKTMGILEDKMWRISDEIGNDFSSFEEVAKNNRLLVSETGFFGPQDVVPEIGLSYEFLNAAFSLEVNQVSNVIETPKGYFIIKIKEKKQSYVPALEEIKKELETAVVKQKSRQLAENKGQDLLAQIKNIMQKENLDFIKTTEKLSLSVKETEEFARFNYISGIGQSVEFVQAAFALKPGEVSELIEVPNGYSVLSLQYVVPIDEERLAQEKEEFSKKLLERKKEIFYKSWLANLKREAKLVNNLKKLKKQTTP